MQVRYVTEQEGGVLVTVDATDEEHHELYRKLWIFINSHRRHVLRDYYRECKAADAFAPHDSPENGNVLVSFFSPRLQHKPYIDILQRELNLQIQDW